MKLLRETLNINHRLAEKVSDLPEFERKKLEKVFKESTKEEINEAFESELEKIQSEEFEGEETETATIVKEEVVQEQSELDMYAQLAERFLPKK